MTTPEYRSWECPTASCGWVRTWRIDAVGYQEIDHPLHGRVTGYTAAMRDIARHDCGEHIAAIGRLIEKGIRQHDHDNRKPKSGKSSRKQAA